MGCDVEMHDAGYIMVVSDWLDRVIDRCGDQSDFESSREKTVID